jgi:hypothetical protein
MFCKIGFKIFVLHDLQLDKELISNNTLMTHKAVLVAIAVF